MGLLKNDKFVIDAPSIWFIDYRYHPPLMKLFPNLAGGLRTFFGVLQTIVVVFTIFWLLVFAFGPRLPGRSDTSRLMVSAGDVFLAAAPHAVQLLSDGAKPDALEVVALRGPLHVDLLSKDHALVSALRLAMFPAMAVLVTFSWLLCGGLRKLCGHISRGEIFSEKNLRLIRNLGGILIGYSIAGGLAAMWASRTFGAYLSEHVNVKGVATAAQYLDGHGAVRFVLADGLSVRIENLVVGCVVLVLAQAFRQGLALKTESELTV
jgi:hypothetical protein